MRTSSPNLFHVQHEISVGQQHSDHEIGLHLRRSVGDRGNRANERPRSSVTPLNKQWCGWYLKNEKLTNRFTETR